MVTGRGRREIQREEKKEWAIQYRGERGDVKKMLRVRPEGILNNGWMKCEER